MAAEPSPTSVQGLFNGLMPIVMAAALMWVGNQIQENTEQAAVIKTEMAFVKASIDQLAADRQRLVRMVVESESFGSNAEMALMRINALESRFDALERELKLMEGG